MVFEWDDEKARQNVRKHGLRFEIAIQAFDDDLAVPFADPEHSTENEIRYALLGICESGLVFISFHLHAVAGNAE